MDLGHIDLLVAEGFYSNRTDFIRTAIRNQLATQQEAVRQVVSRKSLVLGLQRFTLSDLEALQRAGEALDVRVLGLATVDDDVTPALAMHGHHGVGHGARCIPRQPSRQKSTVGEDSVVLKLPDVQRLALPGNSPSSVPNHMNEALALVREGRLQEATALLMGNSPLPTGATATQAAPVPSAPTPRFSNLAARGLAGAQDVLNTLERLPEQTPLAPASAPSAAVPSAWATRPGSHAQPTTANGAEPGRFESVALSHNGVNHTYWLYAPKAAAPIDGRPPKAMLAAVFRIPLASWFSGFSGLQTWAGPSRRSGNQRGA